MSTTVPYRQALSLASCRLSFFGLEAMEKDLEKTKSVWLEHAHANTSSSSLPRHPTRVVRCQQCQRRLLHRTYLCDECHGVFCGYCVVRFHPSIYVCEGCRYSDSDTELYDDGGMSDSLCLDPANTTQRSGSKEENEDSS
eukprot:4438280-Karenia_brevis.AAC.1